ncbi:MAG: hypothetical protein KDJ74_16525 [Notoacmeibacter sp.]|nr:hypothetical protein [Notoacmeibacter sp.]
MAVSNPDDELMHDLEEASRANPGAIKGKVPRIEKPVASDGRLEKPDTDDQPKSLAELGARDPRRHA